MGYFGYLCEARPDVAEANKDKKAEITAIRFDGTDKDLSAEYFMDDTSVKVDLAIGVSDFMDVDTFETQGVTIRSFYLKAGKSEAYREITKQVIKDGFEFFTELLGRYPSAEYTMIQGVDGMEHSGLAFVDGKTFLNSEDEIMNKLQRNIAHEVGHSWFYDAVGDNEYREGWIDEGICTYIASDELLYKDIESYKTETKYGATPIFLRHAKEIMGEDDFYGFLREVYETYTMKVAHTEDTLKILRKYNDSDEMNKLIDFYFILVKKMR